MVNLWGPGAFGAARPAAVRPTFTPANGAGDPDDWAQDCTSPTARDGTEWRSALLNELIAQLRGVARNSSVAPSNLNPVLLAQAIASGNFTWATATGTANAWVVTPSLAVPAYAAGRVLWVKAPATNTQSYVVANVSGLGDRAIKKSDGSAPAIGDLVGGQIYQTIDDGTNIRILTPLPSDILNASARIGRTQVFTASGTFVVPNDVKAVWVRVIGGGGGGGGGPNASSNPGGGGGSAGGYSEKWCAVTSGDSIAVTVGVAGAGGNVGGNGVAGGTSSFGSHCSAAGGAGGGWNGNANSIGGVGTGGDLNLHGSGGQQGMKDGTTPVGAPGGNPPFGGGGTSNSYAAGYSAQGRGAGGGGAGGLGNIGGNGAAGLVVVQW